MKLKQSLIQLQKEKHDSILGDSSCSDKKMSQSFQTEQTQVHETQPHKGLKLKQTLYVQGMKRKKIKQMSSAELYKEIDGYLKYPYRRMSKKQILKVIHESTLPSRKILRWAVKDNPFKITPKLYKLKRNSLYALTSTNHDRRPSLNNLRALQYSLNDKYLWEVLGSWLCYRLDMAYNDVLLHIIQAFYNYTPETPIIIFSLMNIICTSQVYLPFVTNNYTQQTSIIRKVCGEMAHGWCMSHCLEQGIQMEKYVEMWVRSFWLLVDDGVVREKIIHYLILHRGSVAAVARVCESILVGLNPVLSKGHKRNSQIALAHPSHYLYDQMLINYLFIY